MNVVTKVASYDASGNGVTEMPFVSAWQSSFFSSNDDDAHRTGAEMLRQPVRALKRSGSVTYPLWKFRISGVPLSVTVILEDGVWIASIDVLDVFGDGESPREAMSTLEDHLLNFIEFYREQRPADLTEFAKERRAQLLKVRVRG